MVVVVVPCSEAQGLALLSAAGDRSLVRPHKALWFCVGNVAFAALRPDRYVATLCCAWVAPERRRQGVWLALIVARLDAARAMGYHRARTWAYRPEPFERLGFRRRRQTSTGAWLLERDL